MLGETSGICCQALVAAEYVLEHVVGGITGIPLGIDDQPRFPLSGQHVARVQVGTKHHVALGSGGQLAEQGDTGARQARVARHVTVRGFLLELSGSICTSSEVNGRLAPPMRRVVTHFVPTAGGWVSLAGPSICPSTTPFCHLLNRAGSVA
jgi:hypothetical protein